MKKEEAIKLIDTHTVCFYNEIDSPTLQALHLAIEALSADTVSRETYHNLVTASNDIDRALREYQDKEENGEFVSVVRCKDCRHRDLFSCPLADNDFQKDEDFCSWGERREE